MIAFNNGKYQSLDEISIPITSLSINRGYGAYEFFEIINGKAFYGKDHLERFDETLRLLKLEIDFNNRLQEIVEELIRCNKLQNAAIKLLALPHDQNGKVPHRAHLYIIPISGWSYDQNLFENGAKLVTKQFQRFMPRAKSTDYLAGQFWNDQLTDPTIIDILFHNGQTILETSRGNIFVVKNGCVFTPAKNVLLGITRQVILEILKDLNINFSLTAISLNELLNTDEVFVCSSTKRVMPIVKIDGQIIGDGRPGEITKTLQQALQEIVNQY